MLPQCWWERQGLSYRHRFTIKLATQQIIYGYGSIGDRSFYHCKYVLFNQCPVDNATNNF
ncbi:MAG: hypothetical protein V7K35_05220 [Nostoc sp.]